MIQVVVSLVICLIVTFGILMGVLRARKKSVSVEIFRVGMTLVSLLVTILLTALISGAFVGIAVELIADLVPLPDELLSSGLVELVQAFCAAGIAAILFLILFPVITGLLRIPVKPLARLLDRKIRPAAQAETADSSENPAETANLEENPAVREKKSPWRLVLGGVCGLLYAVAMLSPVVGTLQVVGDVASLPAALAEDSDAADIFNTLEETADAIPVKAVWYIGAAPVYKGITTYSGVSVTRETALFADLADYLRDPAEDKGAFSSYSSAPAKSALIGEIIPHITGEVFAAWASGSSYLGISAPVPDGMAGEILSNGLREISELTPDQLRESTLSLTDLAVYLLDSGGVGNMDSLLTDEDRLTDIYACLISSEVLHGALKSALDSGLREMTAKWGGIGIVLADVLPTDADSTRSEARALAHTTVSLIRFNENFSLDGDNLSVTLYNLGAILDGFRDTDLIGEEQVKELMESALRSDEIKNALGYDAAKAEEAIDDILDEIEQSGKSYADLLSELADQAK